MAFLCSGVRLCSFDMLVNFRIEFVTRALCIYTFPYIFGNDGYQKK